MPKMISEDEDDSVIYTKKRTNAFQIIDSDESCESVIEDTASSSKNISASFSDNSHESKDMQVAIEESLKTCRNDGHLLGSTPEKNTSQLPRRSDYFRSFANDSFMSPQINKNAIINSDSEDSSVDSDEDGDMFDASKQKSIIKKVSKNVTDASQLIEISDESDSSSIPDASTRALEASFESIENTGKPEIRDESDSSSIPDASTRAIEASFESIENTGKPATREVQPTLDKFLNEISTPKNQNEEDFEQPKVGTENKTENLKQSEVSNKENLSPISCKRTEYNQQISKVKDTEQQMMKTKTYMSTIKMSNLPDKGQILKDRFEKFKQAYLAEQTKLKKMVVVEEDLPTKGSTGLEVARNNWNNIEAGIEAVQPKTFGKKGLENYQVEKALTVERLEQLHGSLKNCPGNEYLAEQPKGIKIQLMEHQRRALAWLEFRESQKPSGGILADDMGLGKTLTMLSLILATLPKENDVEEEESKRHHKYKGGTLVVCPASLLHQWAGEIDTKLKRGVLSYDIYHGPRRETKPKRLAKFDVVITTYAIIMHEKSKDGAVFNVRWKRIILDEAHYIRNPRANTSVACCELAGKSRWTLTGTPIHNQELDMYALLKFLRCSPFDDLAVWKRWVSDKGSGGGERLHTVISSLMLRRTKSELMESGKITTLPGRKWDLLPVDLDEMEMALYHKVLLFSQSLFEQFLRQRVKDNDWIARKTNVDPNSEYFKMRKKLLKLNKMREINQHEILILILRLRQICCHPNLIIGMLQGDEDLGEVDNEEETEELNLLDQLNKLNLDEDEELDDPNHLSDEPVGIKEAARGILNPSHPIFSRDRVSSKIKSIMNFIPNILSAGDKIIIVSQWKNYLDLIGLHLEKAHIHFLTFDGSVPPHKRIEIVTTFNDPNTREKILLLSLTAGGVGLNLVGANHLFLVDLHWNPQLEQQAQDRIYRMGQKKEVSVYKFMVNNTIEERIKVLQEAKLELANSILTNSKIKLGNKLTLQDLRMLFQL